MKLGLALPHRERHQDLPHSRVLGLDLLRRIGTFLFVTAGVALMDWVLTLVLFGGGGFSDRVIPLTVGLVLLCCPGNGYSVLCFSSALFLLFVTGLAAVTFVAVPFIRLLASPQDQPRPAIDRSRLLAELSLTASVFVTLGFGWSWSRVHPGQRCYGPVSMAEAQG